MARLDDPNCTNTEENTDTNTNEDANTNTVYANTQIGEHTDQAKPTIQDARNQYKHRRIHRHRHKYKYKYNLCKCTNTH